MPPTDKSELLIFVPVFSFAMIGIVILVSKILARIEKRRRIRDLKYHEIEDAEIVKAAREFYNAPNGLQFMVYNGYHTEAIEALSIWLKEHADRLHKNRVRNHVG